MNRELMITRQMATTVTIIMVNISNPFLWGCNSPQEKHERKHPGVTDDNTDFFTDSDSGGEMDSVDALDSESENVEPGSEVFEIWRDAVAALDKSPDNLRERARDVVETGNTVTIWGALTQATMVPPYKCTATTGRQSSAGAERSRPVLRDIGSDSLAGVARAAIFSTTLFDIKK